MSTYTTLANALTVEEIRPIKQRKNDPFAKHISVAIKSKFQSLWGIFESPLIWNRIVFIVVIHLMSLYGFITFPYFSHKTTLIWSFMLGSIGGFGVTGGAHRFWCHRSFKAKLPLRIILMLCYAVAGQNRLFHWVRDHRVHHKYSETEADPHNSNRGFFFAHIGWLMMRKHPEVIRKGKQIDCSDLFEDSVFVFYENYFVLMKLSFCFILPILIPQVIWGETLYWSIMSCIARYVLNLNFTFLVNSVAHLYGNRPYDKNIQPVENLTVSILAMGEGWHNYHHTFPWDYRAAELGRYSVNMTTVILDIFAKIGWAYDLKSPSDELVKKIVENKGDGTHGVFGQEKISPEIKHQ